MQSVIIAALLALAAGAPLAGKLVPNGQALPLDRISEFALGAQCDCSPTDTPVDAAVVQMLVDQLKEINKLQPERRLGASYTALNKCYAMFSMEACVNADKSLRVTPDHVTFCVYDLKTGINTAEEQDTSDFEYRHLKACKPAGASKPTTPSTNQSASKPAASPKPTPKPQAVTAPKEPAPKEPAPKEPAPKEPAPKDPAPKDPAPKEPAPKDPAPKDPAPKEPAPKDPAPKDPAPKDPAPKDTTKPASEPDQKPSNATQAGEPNTPSALKPETTPEGTIGSAPEVSTGPVDPASARGIDNTNEGCVAIEHLQGYVLQHPTHLRRPVLCANDFCATPNHAIIVHGRTTSMKQLCKKEWNCVHAVKLVNNLKISANIEARISEHIVVTPYDLRFPVVLCWLAQIAEDIFYLLANSFVVGAVAAFAVAAASVTSH